jgi:hypothetical protein
MDIRPPFLQEISVKEILKAKVVFTIHIGVAYILSPAVSTFGLFAFLRTGFAGTVDAIIALAGTSRTRSYSITTNFITSVVGRYSRHRK